MFMRKKRQNERRGTIERLYGTIVAQARKPVFYTRMGAPDTVEGRFDLVVLHLFLVNERLASFGNEGKAFAQELLDFFFEDMDASLREIGIGDLSVPKKMRALAEAYLGRSAAYRAALAAGDNAALAASLAKNIYGNDAATPGVEVLARYVLEAFEAMKIVPAQPLFAGEPSFIELEETASDVR